MTCDEDWFQGLTMMYHLMRSIGIDDSSESNDLEEHKLLFYNCTTDSCFETPQLPAST
jgi:hypothetical protein